MRFSDHFGLERNQSVLDFVDIDTYGDVPVFVTPNSLRLIKSEWGAHCIALIRDFFETIIDCVASGADTRAVTLLRGLREPNETHLGLSSGRAQGRAVGYEKADSIWDALKKSEAVQAGLVTKLEDTALLVEGIGPDVVSDITTNLLREPLVRYTQDVCSVYSIPTHQVDSGPLWDPADRDWYNQLTALPVVDGQRIILVPKAIVRRRPEFDPGEYYRHYLLEALQEEELNAPSGLVQILKSGKRRVTKKSLMDKYGSTKRDIIRQTLRHPEALKKYHDDKAVPSDPMSHNELALDGGDVPDWHDLELAVKRIAAGNAHATAFELAIQDLLTALFYPALSRPERQVRIHDGRKILDITFDNVAPRGFFYWAGRNYTAPQIIVECKNYGGEVANPELDQLSGRFSPNRGRVGLLVCRSFDDKQRFLQRCRDTADDQRGFVIPLDDDDISTLIKQRQDSQIDFPLLRERFDGLIN